MYYRAEEGAQGERERSYEKIGLSPQKSDALVVYHFHSLSNMVLKIRALFVMHVLGTSAFSQLENHYVDLAMRYIECISFCPYNTSSPMTSLPDSLKPPINRVANPCPVISMFKLIATVISTDERESRSSASSAQDLLQFLPTNLAYLYLKRIRTTNCPPLQSAKRPHDPASS